MLNIIILLLILSISLYIIINSINKKEKCAEYIPSCILYKYLIVPGMLDYNVKVIEDFGCNDKKDERYLDGLDKIDNQQLLQQIKDANTKNIPIVWIYNPYEISSKFWKDFMSRRDIQPTSSLRSLCLTTILKHFPDYNYRPIVFNQDNLYSLLGDDYKVCRPMYSYLKNEYIKYALLEKYGGFWIPIDTVMMRSINETLNDYYNGKLIVNGYSSTQYKDIFSYDSTYIGCIKGHKIVKLMMIYLKGLSNGFQNEIYFKDTVHKYFQGICENNNYLVSRYNIVSFLNGKGEMLSFEDLYSKNNNMPSLNTLAIVPTLYDITMKKHMFNYIERMNVSQLLESEMWITYAIQMSLK
jgi:hypothetical protein